MEMIDSKTFFKENNFLVIKNLISAENAFLFYEYTKTIVQAVDYKKQVAPQIWNQYWDGGFGEKQVANAFYRYGDPLMDTLMILSLNQMQHHTGLELIPNYTYWRFYEKNNELRRHTDRGSCEISATLCLGYNIDNIDHNVYPNYDWPMYILDKEGRELPIHLKPGDCIIYRGMEVEHWREPFIGLNHSQVFLHYNDANGKVKNYLDGRPIIGVPQHN